MNDLETRESGRAAPAGTPLPETLHPVRAEVEGLHHVRGTMIVRLQGTVLGALAVDDGRAEFRPGERVGNVIADFGEGEDIRRLLRGELNPIVAGLQRRMMLKGDVCLGARILLGLRTGTNFEPIAD